MAVASADLMVVATVREGIGVLVTAAFPVKNAAWMNLQYYTSLADQPKIGDKVKVTRGN